MPESSLNISKIRSYSEELGHKLTTDLFKSKKTITGQEILSLSPIKQVNYFVLKNLFTKWQAEAARLESPYFNYKKEEVKKSMQSLMNVLSQNILIEEKAFQPLLTEATTETLLLLLSPYDYYHNNIENSPYLTIKYLKSQAKYIRINKHLYLQLLEDLENETNDGSFTREVLLEKLETIFKSTNEAPEDIEPYLSQLNNIHPLDVNDFFAEDFNLDLSEEVDLAESGKADQNAPEELEVGLTASEEAEIEEIQHKLFQGFEEMDEMAIEKSRQQLNDRFSIEQKTLNESLSPETLDIATAHASKRVESIQKNISINQRYKFVKELFEGESDAFDQAIKAVEECDSFEDAVGLLVQNYAKNYQWNMQSSEIKDLLKVIIKKFK